MRGRPALGREGEGSSGNCPGDAAVRRPCNGDAASSISLDQATHIAAAEAASPGTAEDLVRFAQSETFQSLTEKARKVKLEAEQHRDLGGRQRDARAARSYLDELGMMNIHMRLQSHVGAPIVNRAETEAQRLYKEAKKAGEPEPFDRYVADAYAKLLTGSGKGSSTTADVVVLVSHEVIQRGWSDVRPGDVCKIPGIGPIAPAIAKEIAEDAFLHGLFFDGTDLRHFKSWSSSAPKKIKLALSLGSPPEIDGPRCVDCGSHFHLEKDHVTPRAANGPWATWNNKLRCWPCHVKKTEADRRVGLFGPRAGPGRAPPSRLK